jgi:DNA processing protein
MLVHEVGAVEALERLRAGDAAPSLRDRIEPRLTQSDLWALSAEDLERGERLGARFVVPDDPEWPAASLFGLTLLAARQLGEGRPRHESDVAPPLGLWIRGPASLSAVTERAVALVGARACTSYGSHVAAELGYGLAGRDWAVVSGGAYGIDVAAHRAALAAGGVTVGVLACGVDTSYPVAHTNLFERIAEEGLLVSEWPLGASPRRHRFLVRNRVIAALTAGTVVVEAAARSGALATGRRARDLGRQLMAVPGPVTSAMSVGAHRLLREGGATLVASTDEVLEQVGQIGDDLTERLSGPQSERDRLDHRARLMYDVLGSRGRSVEFLAAEAGVSVFEAADALAMLESAGLVAGGSTGFRAVSFETPLPRMAVRPVLR